MIHIVPRSGQGPPFSPPTPWWRTLQSPSSPSWTKVRGHGPRCGRLLWYGIPTELDGNILRSIEFQYILRETFYALLNSNTFGWEHFALHWVHTHLDGKCGAIWTPTSRWWAESSFPVRETLLHTKATWTEPHHTWFVFTEMGWNSM